MPFPRKRNALQFTEPELRKLESIRKSRTEQKHQRFRPAPAWMALLTRCSLLNTQSKCSADPCRTALRDAASIDSRIG
jgi:hypothetical protein